MPVVMAKDRSDLRMLTHELAWEHNQIIIIHPSTIDAPLFKVPIDHHRLLEAIKLRSERSRLVRLHRFKLLPASLEPFLRIVTRHPEIAKLFHRFCCQPDRAIDPAAHRIRIQPMLADDLSDELFALRGIDQGRFTRYSEHIPEPPDHAEP